MKKLYFTLIFLFISVPCFGAITLTDGFWSTSFSGCATGNAVYGEYTCDGLSLYEASSTCGGAYSQVGTDYNNSSGEGGNGFRAYYNANTQNSFSSTANVTFATPQKEFWLRFYYRIPNGQTVGSIREHKLIYAFTDDTVAVDVNWPGGDNNFIVLQPRNTMGSPDISYRGPDSGCTGSYGAHCIHGGPAGSWATVYGGNPSTTNADGSWHYFEFHFDLGTTTSNGKFEMWVDGVNHVSDTDLDWFAGGTQTPTGWTYIYFPANHNYFTLSGCAGHDIDDIAVAIPTYAGFVHDSGTRDMIGAYSGEDTSSPTLGGTVISSNGTTITLTFAENTSQGSAYQNSHWDIDCSSTGNNIGMVYASGNGTNSHVYTLAHSVNAGEVCNIDFSGTADSMEDGAGNDLAAIVSGTIINNSTLAVSIPSAALCTLSGGVVK